MGPAHRCFLEPELAAGSIKKCLVVTLTLIVAIDLLHARFFYAERECPRKSKPLAGFGKFPVGSLAGQTQRLRGGPGWGSETGTSTQTHKCFWDALADSPQ
jgi:hypothetical protein